MSYRGMGTAPVMPPVAPIADAWYQRKARELQAVAASTALADTAPTGPRPAGPPPWAMIVGWGSVVAVAAGIFWYTSKGAPLPMRANRRRRRSRRTSRRDRKVHGP